MEETAVVEETVQETVVEESPQLSEEAQQFFKDRGVISDEPVAESQEESAPEAEVTAEETPEEPKVSKVFSEVAKKKRELFKQEQELKEKNEDLGKLRDARNLIEQGKHLEASESIWKHLEAL